MTNLYLRRRLRNRLAMGLAIVAMTIGIAVLIWILSSLLINGISGLSDKVFTQMTPAPGNDGGLANAIVGSLMIVTVAALVATPIGILVGIYLAEVGGNSKLATVVRFVNDLLLSAPSIVIGLFVYAVYIAKIGHFSGWGGSFALALIAIPVVVRTTENMLKLVPNSLREAAYALGAPRWVVVRGVTVKAALAGITTGILLAVARMSGETAPLLFTALNNQFWSLDMNAPMANLPMVIFQFAMSPFEDWKKLAWVGALLITLAVLGLSMFARSLTSKKK
jgi:phosphate transport system permease protein